MRKCYDYIYISLSQEQVLQLRVDLPQDLRQTLLKANPFLTVLWRTHPRPDRTHHIFFTTSTKEQAESLKEKLDKWIEEDKGYATFNDYISKPMGPWHVMYDFLNLAHVDMLVNDPPIIKMHTYSPHHPHFITPSYSYKVAVTRCHDWHSAHSVLDNWIHMLFPCDGSNPIIHSAMELNSNVYTAVLPSWGHAIHVMSSHALLETYLAEQPYTWHIKSVPQPALLYCLNSTSLSINHQPAGDLPSLLLEFKQLKREFKHTCDQGAKMMGTLFCVSTQNTEAINLLSTQMTICNANSTALAILQSLSNQLLDINMCLLEAHCEHSQSQLFLLQCNLPKDISDHHLLCTQESKEEI